MPVFASTEVSPPVEASGGFHPIRGTAAPPPLRAVGTANAEVAVVGILPAR